MELNIRKSLLGVSPADLSTDRNIKLEIHIMGRLPFITMSQSYGTGQVVTDVGDVATVEYNKSFYSKLSPDIINTKCFNIPVDKDDASRFSLVSTVGSILTQDVSWLIYDAKFKDLILIPSLSLVGDTDKTKDSRKDTTVIIEGYQVGGGVSVLSSNIIQTIEQLNLEKPPAEFITKSHLMSINGFDDVMMGAMTNGTTFGIKYIELTSQNAIPFASLGPSATLGGDVDVAHMARHSLSSYSLQPGKKIPYDDILIPTIL